MKIHRLDHVNIRTTRLEDMVDWYTNVLGLSQGFRPKFSFPGAWMYVDDAALVHLVGIDGEPDVGSGASLKLEHFAFSATGGAGFEENLRAHGVDYRRVDIQEINLYQVNLRDLDGNHIHVDFPLDE